MTKGTFGVEDTKLSDAPTSVYVQVPTVDGNDTVSVQGVNNRSATVMYVLSILATFCCIPLCSIIGLVHAMIAKHEGERGNVLSHQRRLYQAKCWTGWSIALGLACWLSLLIFTLAMIYAPGYMYGICGGVLMPEDWYGYNDTYAYNYNDTYPDVPGDLIIN